MPKDSLAPSDKCSTALPLLTLEQLALALEAQDISVRIVGDPSCAKALRFALHFSAVPSRTVPPHICARALAPSSGSLRSCSPYPR